MSYLMTSSRPSRDMAGPYLRGWYPGIGEVRALETLPLMTKRFLAEASDEDPDFLQNYLVPTLGEPNPHERLLSDMVDAIESLEDEAAGSFGFLGDLGKGSFFKKVGKALGVKKLEQAAHFVQREVKKEVKTVEKIARKYGPIILTVVGAVLSPFTGGASMAAATLLIAAQKMYQAKQAAEKAKRENNKQAAAMVADAAAQEAETTRQVDAFYSQNQQWFIDQMGVTPDKWAQLTLTQKIDLINNGASGKVPAGPPPEPAPAYTDPGQFVGPSPNLPSGGPPAPSTQMGPAPQSPGVGPSMVPGPADGGADFQSSPAPRPPAGGAAAPDTKISEASMFGGSSILLPAAILVGAVMMSGGLTKGGGRRRARRNPGRRGRAYGRGRRAR